MKKIRDILRRKMDFMFYNGNQKNYWHLEQEFVDFVFETPELALIIRKLVLKNKISVDWLRNAFMVYAVTHKEFPESESKTSFPLFYNEEVEREFKLLESFKDVLNEELKAVKSGIKLDVKEIEKSASVYTRDDFYHVKKLYSDIIQEIDLLESRKKLVAPILAGIEFNEKKGVLYFSGQEIELSKKGKETDAVLLLKTLLKTDEKEWLHNDEILSDWGYTEADLERIPKNKVYFAGQKINTAVALKTKIEDFIECNTSKARINPKYRK